MGTILLPNLWEKKQEVCTGARTEITREPLSWDKCILPQVMDGLRVWGRVGCGKQRCCAAVRDQWDITVGRGHQSVRGSWGPWTLKSSNAFSPRIALFRCILQMQHNMATRTLRPLFPSTPRFRHLWKGAPFSFLKDWSFGWGSGELHISLPKK